MQWEPLHSRTADQGETLRAQKAGTAKRVTLITHSIIIFMESILKSLHRHAALLLTLVLLTQTQLFQLFHTTLYDSMQIVSTFSVDWYALQVGALQVDCLALREGHTFGTSSANYSSNVYDFPGRDWKVKFHSSPFIPFSPCSRTDSLFQRMALLCYGQAPEQTSLSFQHCLFQTVLAIWFVVIRDYGNAVNFLWSSLKHSLVHCIGSVYAARTLSTADLSFIVVHVLNRTEAEWLTDTEIVDALRNGVTTRNFASQLKRCLILNLASDAILVKLSMQSTALSRS